MGAPIRSRKTTESAPPAAAPKFVHLKVHSDYSLLEGALQIEQIAKLAELDAMPAIALTDTNNMFGALEFSEKLARAGIQPIVGCTLQTDLRDGEGGSSPLGAKGEPATKFAGPIALLAAGQQGYASLMKLVSACYLEPDDRAPHVNIDHLQAHQTGVIALTGGPEGPVDSALRRGQVDLARARLRTLQRTFNGSLYVEVQRHGLKHEREVEPQLLALAYELEVPLVATNECYFATPDDHEAHDALLCIAAGSFVTEDNRRRLSKEHYFKSADEMARLFADLPEALGNTIEIAKRCAFRPTGRKPILPRFVSMGAGASEDDQLAGEAAELRAQAEAGLESRLAGGQLAEGFSIADYRARLAFELEVIAKMKFPGYFLIVADFIKWAKANGIAVGPGRGSGAGSVVAWALTITDLDPLRFGLLFERFLNPERISMPDFDIDFCQERRDEVIRYVQHKYGVDRVAQIITHGKLQARAVLRDVGRVLQMPYGQVAKLCKLVPNNPANPVTLKEAIASEPKLQEARDSEPVVARLLEIAQKLEGLFRHASTHAAGIVIGDRPLDELVPLYRDQKSNFPITQFNWKMVEAAGLVKFDFLGLKTLTVLQKAVELIRTGRGIEIDLAKVPLNDKNAFELLVKADTVGVFQLESTGMRESLKRLRPDRFEDIMAMTALYRPGPMDNIPTYINRKHGEEPVDYLHPMLEPILKETYGVIIYQEQVLQIAQRMAGYTLGQADILRKAMGKKDKAIMAKQQAEFVAGAVKNGVGHDEAVYIFELVDKFAGYGFNRAHTAAYAHVAYFTAYLKANYREEFLAASMTLDMGNTDKLALFAGEARKSGIDLKPPCVNTSGIEFVAEAPKTEGQRGAIRYALAALKNIGASAVETIVKERAANGTFKDLSDFARRFDAKVINKRGLETLAAGGAFDALHANRALVHANADQLLALANRLTANQVSGTDDLFGSAIGVSQVDLRPVKAWTPMERLSQEFEAIGFYLSGHPLDEYESVLAKLGALSYAEFEARAGRGASTGRLAAIVASVRERKSQKGNKFAFVVFSDQSGQFEAVVFSDTLNTCRDLLEPGTPVLVSVEGERDGETLKLRVQGLEALDKVANGVQRGLKVVLDRHMIQSHNGRLDELRARLRPGGKGEVHLVMELEDHGRALEIALPGQFDVSPAQRGILLTVPGVLEVVEM
jgi:DNA polymerase III subunit alpha